MGRETFMYQIELIYVLEFGKRLSCFVLVVLLMWNSWHCWLSWIAPEKARHSFESNIFVERRDTCCSCRLRGSKKFTFLPLRFFRSCARNCKIAVFSMRCAFLFKLKMGSGATCWHDCRSIFQCGTRRSKANPWTLLCAMFSLTNLYDILKYIWIIIELVKY